MTVTFPTAVALSADVIGARPAADPTTGAEAIEFAVQPDGEEAQVFSLSICAAYQLREVLDAALEAPFHWDDDDVRDQSLAAALDEIDELFVAEVVDLARQRTVRWDETWARSHPR